MVCAQNTAKTSVSGVVMDARTASPLPYVTVQFDHKQAGVRTDINGRFLMESLTPQNNIRVTYLGFAPQTISIKPSEHNDVKVLLTEAHQKLNEVTIRPDKYSTKNNPAVDLIEQVFLHKDQNRKEGLDYYSYEKHERLRFDLSGVTEKFRKRWYFRKFQFVFDYCDTSTVSQKVNLPFYLRERLLETYYRRDPATKKEKLIAERQTAFEDDYDVDRDGVSTYLTSMYSDIDIYEPNILLLDKQFIGPLSKSANTFYRFYIRDTVCIGNDAYADVFFAPKTKGDLAFMGNMLVALDSTYAVKRVEMGISKDINLNWLSDLHIEQEFDFVGEVPFRRLLLTKDVVTMDLKIWKNREGRSLLAARTNLYKKYSTGTPLPDSLFNNKKILLLRDTGDVNKRTPEFWQQRRHDSLSVSENGVGTMIKSVKETNTFKLLSTAGTIFSTGFYRVGGLMIGELGNCYTFNDLEGMRLRASVKTNDRFSKKINLRGYVAYGLRDQKWKASGSAYLAFKGARPRRYPANQLKLHYEHDLQYPGQAGGGENFFTSIQRGESNRLLLHRIARIEYTKEFTNGFSYSVNTQQKIVSGAGALLNPPTMPDIPGTNANAITTEAGFWVRYAPNERFLQGGDQRTPIASKWPVFFLQYRAGLKGILGGNFDYQRVSLRMDKSLYLAPFGKSRLSVESGGVFGQVSYPFLEIHRANQTFFFDDLGFNLMRYLEFVSDRYAVLHLNHDFGGLLFNRIPILKKYRLREGFTFKALCGDLSARNLPTPNNKLLSFPIDRDGKAISRPLNPLLPYSEVSVGIGNIFGFMRVESVWRVTYKDPKPSNNWGVFLIMNAQF